MGRGPRGYRRSDERIREDVCDRFTEHGDLDPADVEVTVFNGEVVLVGSVSTRGQRRLAVEIADAVPGVVEVHDHLRVGRTVLEPDPFARPLPDGPVHDNDVAGR